MKTEIYQKQIPQVSAMNNGTFNIHLKGFKFADSIEDLLFGNVDAEAGGLMEVEITRELNTNDIHLMNVIRNKEITQVKTIEGLVIPITHCINKSRN